ncbi:LuxR C-terminal-related transcriptional regulator [Amycolatopsis sp., V23-08]|uniref:LuxR C-terminal-related transcriptional regulator n=1 Tax=Amycolatopsis heterodermiae TaxID=3110235 RepID=A0ABU5RL36_9PSEU|nr:LuxR C-terminal-related transcriptional regulator [Amycolatopsis sp., V23-08]MEA5366235.1 LuxR C-terminal-related transcriptional regulator [Amycolatopsis sp., V23-08]
MARRPSPGAGPPGAAYPTTFVGQLHKVTEVESYLDEGTPVVTMTGSGGVGKTRMAGEVFRRRRDRYDAAAFVRLAEMSDEADGEPTIGRICTLLLADLRVANHQPDAQPLDVLTGFLRDRRVLLVLDNCEHLLGPVQELVDLLINQASQLQIIATSRAWLQIHGARIVHLNPLRIPGENAGRAEAEECDAVRLLQDRAALAGRPLTAEDDWSVIVQLVRWSDGIPLILELVAAQLSTGRSPRVVFDRLEGGLSLRYAPGTRGVQAHHLALDVAIGESWKLCSEVRQRVWARLTVFTGGFTLEAAEQVCADAVVDRAEILTTLDYLVQHSIIEGASADGRYRQHNYLSEYGRRCLRRFGDQDAIEERLCAWVAQLVREAAEGWFGPDEMCWLSGVDAESGNIATVVTWCAERGQVERGMTIMVDLLRTGAPYFFATEIPVCRQVEKLLQAESAKPSPARVSALAMVGWIWTALGARERGKAHRDDCLHLAQQIGVEKSPAVQFVDGTYDALALGLRSGYAKLEAAREGFRAAGADGSEYMAGLFHALTAGLLGPVGEADRMSQWCLDAAYASGAAWAITWAEWTRGLPEGSQPQASARNALRAQVKLGDLWGPAWGVEEEARKRVLADDYLSAAYLYGGSDSLQARHGVRFNGLPGWRHHRDIAIAAVIEAIGEEVFEAARDAGGRWRDDRIVSFALGDANPTSPALTERQWQITRMVSDEKSNIEIGAALHNSARTVEGDLTKIYRLLNLRGRAELVEWYEAYVAPSVGSTAPEAPPRRG